MSGDSFVRLAHPRFPLRSFRVKNQTSFAGECSRFVSPPLFPFRCGFPPDARHWRAAVRAYSG